MKRRSMRGYRPPKSEEEKLVRALFVAVLMACFGVHLLALSQGATHEVYQLRLEGIEK